MTPQALLETLAAAGVELRSEGGRLYFDAPAGAMTPALREAVRSRRGALLALLDGGPAVPPGDAAPSAGDEAPLSHAQQSLCVLEALDPASTAASEQFAIRLDGPLSVAALEAAWLALRQRHAILRTVFPPVGEMPVQRVADAPPEALVPVDVTDEEALRTQATAALATPFDKACAPPLRARLLRLSQHVHVLLVTAHHLVADGLSVPVIRRELAALYAAALSGRPPALPPATRQYADFARRQRAAAPPATAIEYWQARLQDLPPPLATRLPAPAGPVAAEAVRRVSFALPPALAVALRAFARANRTTPFVVLLAAWRLLLGRLASERDVPIGSPLTLRDTPALGGMIGCLVNPVVLRTPLDGADSFRDLVRRERDTVLEALAHRAVPFAEVVARCAPRREAGRHPLFQVLFALEGDDLGVIEAGGLDFAPLSIDAPRRSWFDLECGLRDGGAAAAGGGLGGHISWSPARIDDRFASALAPRLLRLLGAALERPETACAALDLLDEAERRLVTPPADDQHLPRAGLWPLFEAQVRRTPQAVALRGAQGDVTHYTALHGRALALAARLHAAGLAPGEPLALALGRSTALVVALLAVARTGLVGVPLDPAWPAARRRHILADAGARVVLGVGPQPDDALPDGLTWLDAVATAAAPRDDEIAALPAVPSADAPCLLLYTSGSTGEPKGSVTLQRGVAWRCSWMWRTFGLGTDEVFALRTSPNFIDALWEVWGPLLHGASLCPVDDACAGDALALPECLAARGITQLVLVPGLLRAVLERDDLPALPALRTCISSGEPLDPALVRRCHARLPHVQLINTYGTSEIWDATWYDTAHLDPAATRVPIGRPLPYARVRVLDAFGALLPPGVTGEIVVGGGGIGAGYWRRPALDARAFVSGLPGMDGRRAYRTGDRGRWNAG